MIGDYQKARKNHNYTHGILLQIYHVLKNYYYIKRESGITFENENLKFTNKLED
jgi:hypothetical protein